MAFKSDSALLGTYKDLKQKCLQTRVLNVHQEFLKSLIALKESEDA